MVTLAGRGLTNMVTGFLGRPSPGSDRMHAAFYLADDLRALSLVRPTELSVGFPTVRLEVTFGQ